MTRMFRTLVIIGVALAYLLVPLAAQRTVDLDAVTIADVNAAFARGTLTSERLVQMFLARIDAYDRKGPTLRAVITVNPKAVEQARALDAERKAKGPRSPLHGIPVIIKDQVDVNGMPKDITLAKSSGFARLDEQALQDMRSARFAPQTENGQPIEWEVIAPMSYEVDR